MKNDRVRYLARTAMLLALTVVFQAVGRFLPLGANASFVVGPLVNACLIISAALVGIYAGTVVSVLSPIGAILTGAVMPLPLVPFIALGNFALVLFVCLLKRKRVIGLVVGAVAKYIVIYGSLMSVIPYFKFLPSQQAAKLASKAFGWPQLVTALLGGIIAFPIILRLQKRIKD